LAFKNPLPQRLREARQRADISQKKLGIRIGMEPSSASGRMNHYEKGRHIPDLQTLKHLAEELGVPLNYFFCETEEMAKLVKIFYQMDKERQSELLRILEQKVSQLDKSK